MHQALGTAPDVPALLRMLDILKHVVPTAFAVDIHTPPMTLHAAFFLLIPLDLTTEPPTMTLSSREV